MSYVDQLQNAYPHVSTAIAWMELIVCSPDPDDPKIGSTWDMVMGTTPPIPPHEVLEVLLETIGSDCGLGQEEQIYREMQHPEFMMYLLGKMGCV